MEYIQLIKRISTFFKELRWEASYKINREKTLNILFSDLFWGVFVSIINLQVRSNEVDEYIHQEEAIDHRLKGKEEFGRTFTKE